MIFNHELNIVHDFGVATVRLLGHLGDDFGSANETCGLGVEDKGYCEEPLDPFFTPS